MDIHPWTRYEIARIRDEERLLRARAAMRASEVGAPHAEVGQLTPRRTASWLDRLRHREPVADQATVGARSA
jgi:hypothetical protein